jgi:hypothetical protein
MAGLQAPSREASLLPITVRRSIAVGRIYLALGTGLALLLSLLLAAHPAAFASVFPLEIPLFATTGSLGSLMVFTADRTKGVFEYLIAYGARPRTLFANGVLAAVALAALVLGAALAVGLGAFVASGGRLTFPLVKALALYTLPMSLAAALFATTAGMYWSTFSTPRTGMNSPVGIAPLLGVGPTVVVLIAAESAPASEFYSITVSAAAILGAVVIVLVALSGTLMRRERFLSQI